MSRLERNAAIPNRSTASRKTSAPATPTPRMHSAAEPSTRRSKSRSPSRSRLLDPFSTSQTPPINNIKRKRSTDFAISPFAIPTEATVDRGQRIKSRPSSSSGAGAISIVTPPKHIHRSSAPSSSTLRPRPESSSRPDVKGKGRQHGHGSEVVPSRPVTPSSEYDRMRKDLEATKKLVHDYKKQLKKQNKTVEELKLQVQSEISAREERDRQIIDLTSKAQKNDGLIQSVESSLQCQICIELFTRPYLLTPCGHMFCLDCLQQWFRSAPQNEHDDQMDLDPDYALRRQKKCPCCRGRITRRPVPVFVIKNMVGLLRPETSASTMMEDVDPWKGLFPSLQLMCFSDEDNDEDEEDDENGSDASSIEGPYYGPASADSIDPYELVWMDDNRMYESGTDSENVSASEEEQGEIDSDEYSDQDVAYDFPRWEPPSRVVPFNNARSAMWKMLRRGCSPALVTMFGMSYSHEDGLVAHVSSLDPDDPHLGLGRHSLYLGWNVSLPPSHIEGDAEHTFIRDQLRDLQTHPVRWIVSERFGFGLLAGGIDARKLVVVDEDVDVYDTSDSEAYSNGINFV
ncbi:unnamed protein product [Mycena citricolor]|uniref:RING-type domain-containing protein n=1 Tax=Mycena citricolor TaxID=2018698 RepID=A0AAD2HF87_9AGAR|nr:unnamed protein product [Mycena citricolor]